MDVGSIQTGKIVNGAICKGVGKDEKVAVVELTGLTKEQQEKILKKMTEEVYRVNKENERRVKFLNNGDPDGAYNDWNDAFPRGVRREAFAAGIEWARKHKI